MRFLPNNTEKWLEAIRVKDIIKTSSNINWRGSISNYTDGRRSVSISKCCGSNGTMHREIFFNDEEDMMNSICVDHGTVIEVYSESHLNKVGILSESSKLVKSVIFVYEDGTCSGVELDYAQDFDMDLLTKKHEKVDN